MTSERAAISAIPDAISPAASARSRVAGLRPSAAHSTRCPAPARHFPTAAPISPGWNNPTVTSLMPLLSPVQRVLLTSGMLAGSGVNVLPLITPTRGSAAE